MIFYAHTAYAKRVINVPFTLQIRKLTQVLKINSQPDPFWLEMTL